MRVRGIIFFTVFICLACTAFSGEGSFTYYNAGKRDPFVPLIGIQTRTAGSLEDVMSVDEIELQGTALDAGGRQIVILNNEMVREGETVGRVTVKRVLSDKVILDIDGDSYELCIYEESL